MGYYPINALQSKRNLTAGRVPASIQYRALAYNAGMPANGVYVTEADAIRCGFVPMGSALWTAVSGGFEHPQFDARKLMLVGKTLHTSRVNKGFQLAESIDADGIALIVARANKRKIRAIAANAGQWGEVLAGFVPDKEAVERVAMVHRNGGAGLEAFCLAARWFKVSRTLSI